MVTKELLKFEIDKVPEGNLEVLYKIVKALEEPPRESMAEALDDAAWKALIAETYGSMADAPIERGEQGTYEDREPFECQARRAIGVEPGVSTPGQQSHPSQ